MDGEIPTVACYLFLVNEWFVTYKSLCVIVIRWLMSGSKDRSVVFWDPRNSQSVLTLTGYRTSVISVASSPASPYFATGSGDCVAAVWKYQHRAF